MEAINIEKAVVCLFSAQTDIIAGKGQYLNLADFLKGTISGNELVKYVCDRLDETCKYRNNPITKPAIKNHQSKIKNGTN